MQQEKVQIYNLGGVEKLSVVSLRHAIRMLHRGVARVHTAKPGEKFGAYERPVAVELLQYVFAKWMYQTTGRTMYSKSGVLRRDKHTCAYCGRTAQTVDHVIPQARGGLSTWLNTVAACWTCNQRKADSSLRESGMKLQWLPYTPAFEQVYTR